MLSGAYFGVISPEGAASILGRYKDDAHKAKQLPLDCQVSGQAPARSSRPAQSFLPSFSYTSPSMQHSVMTMAGAGHRAVHLRQPAPGPRYVRSQMGHSLLVYLCVVVCYSPGVVARISTYRTRYVSPWACCRHRGHHHLREGRRDVPALPPPLGLHPVLHRSGNERHSTSLNFPVQTHHDSAYGTHIHI